MCVCVYVQRWCGATRLLACRPFRNFAITTLKSQVQFFRRLQFVNYFLNYCGLCLVSQSLRVPTPACPSRIYSVHLHTPKLDCLCCGKRVFLCHLLPSQSVLNPHRWRIQPLSLYCLCCSLLGFLARPSLWFDSTDSTNHLHFWQLLHLRCERSCQCHLSLSLFRRCCWRTSNPLPLQQLRQQRRRTCASYL